MKLTTKILFFCLPLLLGGSCVSKKKLAKMEEDHKQEIKKMNREMKDLGFQVNEYMRRLERCENAKDKQKEQLIRAEEGLKGKEQQVRDLRAQIKDYKEMRDQQLTQVGDLTVLSQSANENINRTLAQLEGKDKYIRLLQSAKNKADSINLALAVNLKGVLAEGIEDKDVEIKVDKTVVFINLSDKMLYNSGSANIRSDAHRVLGKIAKIIKTKPDIEVMVEGYTDDVPIRNSCMTDNWDLSVKRATSVVRALQKNHGVDPNKLIAAGRGEYNRLASNTSPEGRAANRRTRIIILPKLDQFYDLLNPDNVPD